MTVDTGYQVDPTALHKYAGTAQDEAARIAGYPTRMRMLTCPSADVLGEHADIAAAYGGFLNAWVEEYELTSQALAETSTKLDASATQYGTQDRLHADSFDRAVR
ncbi:MAG TPA: hypothetical protein VH969_10090 [Actinophytocola sp.]|jgi:hypothetical protein|uniref:hypothetical protein n=1 Tax=Actinophytocola sp. TaxID=1872138 RepID=UPI002F95EF57